MSSRAVVSRDDVRAQEIEGELRIVSGVEACKKWSEVIAEMSRRSWGKSGGEGVQAVHLVEKPFTAGESELRSGATETPEWD